MIPLDHQPFGTSWLFLLDTTRVITILLDVWLIFWILYTARKVLPATRQWGCAALAMYMLGAVVVNFIRLGSPIGVMLVTSIAGTVFAFVYIVQVRGQERWDK